MSLYSDTELEPYGVANTKNKHRTTKSGDNILIADMDNEHLLNAYKMGKDERLYKELQMRVFQDYVKRNK
jgi:hypothetical protein